MLALELKTFVIAPKIVDNLLPVTQDCANVVMDKLFKGKKLEDGEELINVGSCLELLHLTALGCMSKQEHITRFWQLMVSTTVCMALSYKQPVEHTILMLQLLSTSILPDSFGMVIVTGNPQTKESHINFVLDYISNPLHGTRYKPGNEDDPEGTPLIPMEAHHVLRIRLEVLQLLTSMTRSPFAGAAMATHSQTIPRLVCLISDELDALYDHGAGQASSALIITLATRLLYHLTTQHESEINMQQKLRAIHGGSHKYLLVLARLNFKEDDLVLESGIADDVPRLALEMLEGAVTPDEGDQILRAFEPA